MRLEGERETERSKGEREREREKDCARQIGGDRESEIDRQKERGTR